MISSSEEAMGSRLRIDFRSALKWLQSQQDPVLEVTPKWDSSRFLVQPGAMEADNLLTRPQILTVPGFVPNGVLPSSRLYPYRRADKPGHDGMDTARTGCIRP
jgi:hypothetical protein